MEFVYVVRRFDLYPHGFPHGLVLPGADAIGDLRTRIRHHGFFVERRHAETDATLKQVIPYCVVLRGDDVFLTERTARGGESRLHGKRSVGIGGHVNPPDDTCGTVRDPTPAGKADVVARALDRELDEELEFSGGRSTRVVGVLNDDSTDVGSVHFGLVAVVRTQAEVHVRETDVLTGGFTVRSDWSWMLRAERERFETWSAFVLDRWDDLLVAAAPDRPSTDALQAGRPTP